MTLNEAIEEFEHELAEDVYHHKERLSKALRLGIEALKEVKASRQEDYIGDTGLLPGETKD